MKNFIKKIPDIAAYFFIFLFCYAAISKLTDFENFQVQIAQSPLLTAFAGFTSYVVIIVELIIVFLLLIPRLRLIGLYASLGLMTAFTIYIYLILNYSDFVPCSCGGILEKMGWTEHLLFNIACVLMAGVSIWLTKYYLHDEQNEKNRNCRSVFLHTASMVLFVCSVSSAVVIALFFSSEHIIKKENNFTRRFQPHPVYNEKAIDLGSNTFYFAGNSTDSIFLGNREAPLIMATILPDFKVPDIDTLTLNDYRYPFKNVELNIIYPYYSLADGTVPILYEGVFPNKRADKTDIGSLYFSKIKMTGPHHYIFKTTLAANREGALGVFNSITGVSQLNTSILEKQIDGLFDTDGDFRVETARKKMIYTYYYRNEYITTDLQLKSKTTGHTIDTVSKARIHLKDMAAGSRQMTAPPLEVNQMQAVHSSTLFNISKLRGRYESKNRWKEAEVIDVYDYESKTYQYSFYIYHHDKQKIRDMLLTKSHLYILSGNQLIRYQRR